MSKHTQGPWRWEISEKYKSLHLVGGRPKYDLTIIDPARWGLNGATLMLRDPAHDGMNIMHKVHERRDWITPFPGRAHHADWCADVDHPDMRLIAAAPELLEALGSLLAVYSEPDQRICCSGFGCGCMGATTYQQAEYYARAAIAKAKGESA